MQVSLRMERLLPAIARTCAVNRSAPLQARGTQAGKGMVSIFATLGRAPEVLREPPKVKGRRPPRVRVLPCPRKWGDGWVGGQ